MDLLAHMQTEADAIANALMHMNLECANGHDPCNCLKENELASALNRRADLLHRIELVQTNQKALQNVLERTPLMHSMQQLQEVTVALMQMERSCYDQTNLSRMRALQTNLVQHIEQCKKKLAQTQNRQEEMPLWGVARLLNDFSK